MFDMDKVAVLIRGSIDGDFYAIRLDGRVWEFDSDSYDWFMSRGEDTSSSDFQWREMSELCSWGRNKDWILANEQIDRWELEQLFIFDGGSRPISDGAL